ncbi:hypothetical protein BOX15_Mlig007807g1 [Macrostomum lignano]|uniref:EGF-like domain-containing protein n=1 Tax=Macrostomum lignano TaxID=282301 RepID=A0A267F271_9PLAT|nr:hypothetical protein BOX15_Mlig007807g1 [Macrostomum lignano]
MQHQRMLSLSLSILVVALNCSISISSLICENGGTFDSLNYECICTPNSYGIRCETLFVTSDPCADWKSKQVIHDSQAVHRLGNAMICGESPDLPCVDFSVIKADWYRLASPAGGQLVIGCPTGAIACGSQQAYFLVNETIEQEDNANRILLRARAYRYRPNLTGSCFLSGDTSYPVRILKCFSELTLYYLQPLPSFLNHYCIGSKAPCDAGLISVEGTGFEPCIRQTQCLPKLTENALAPQLRLDYEVKPNGQYKALFRCNVFASFQVNTSEANGVLYRIEFELNFRNGTSVLIQKCVSNNISIGVGKNRTFECRSEYVLARETNVYGGSLTCRSRAKCRNSGAEYNSMPVVSNSHGFYFKHYFQGARDVITPNEPTSLCIDSVNIPALTEVQFFVSVGRQQIISTDQIDVSIIRRDGNESLSCGFAMKNDRRKNKKVCIDMMLYNHDPDNRIPLGLTKGQQISIIKVNISFASMADGLFTVLSNGTWFPLKIQNIEMKVDLSRLMTDVTTYLHLYTDPQVKTAKSAYTSEETFGISNGYYSLLAHRILPYEIQVKVDGWYVTEISMRYLYYIISIRGSSSTGSIQNPEVTYKVPPRDRDSSRRNLTLPLERDGLPFGVTAENVGYAMKIRFKLYGTILYVWGFRTGSLRDCLGNFVMSNANMQAASSCAKSFYPVGNGRIALDVMVVPGFYDTPNMVEGLIYGSNRGPIDSNIDNMFSSQFQMPAIKDYSKRIQPTEILGICTCGKKELLTSNCFVSINNVKRDKRTAEAAPVNKGAVSFQQLPKREISQKEADEFCNTFVQLQLRRSVSTDICAQMKDPTGQADYISQFKLICAQYATVLGTFDSTQSLFNSMLGMCYTEMTYNASVVLGNSSKIEALVEDLCPSNCSGRGQCLSGECACMDGFWGPGCEFEIARRDEIPIEVELLQRSIFCSSDKCTAVYLSVKPLLRSTDSVCNIQLNSSLNYSTPSVYISGDIVKCELQEIHDSLFEDQRMFLLLQISLTAADWESSNSVSVLLHQAQCDGRPVTCDSDLLTCQAAGLQRENGGGGSECPPTLEKRGCLRLPTASLLVTVTVLIALINYY